MTASERNLWRELRKLGMNIRRQASIGRYIADFAQHEARLVIEVDGARHDLDEARFHDAERDAWLASQGYRVIRVRDEEAFGAPVEVAQRIAAEIDGRVGRAVKAATP